jgi:hypothetical protein
VKKAKIYLEGLTIHLQDRLVLFSNLSYNDLVSATIDQERLMKVIADADERKRKMMMSVSSGSGGSSGAFLKYRMVYTPPPHLGQLCHPPQQYWAKRPQYQ